MDSLSGLPRILVVCTGTVVGLGIVILSIIALSGFVRSRLKGEDFEFGVTLRTFIVNIIAIIVSFIPIVVYTIALLTSNMEVNSACVITLTFGVGGAIWFYVRKTLTETYIDRANLR